MIYFVLGIIFAVAWSVAGSYWFLFRSLNHEKAAPGWVQTLVAGPITWVLFFVGWLARRE